MRLEDKLAYRLLNESNHRVLNQYELYFLIENLFNNNSNKRLNEVDWRYRGGRIKGFVRDVFNSWNSGGETQPRKVNLPKETPPYGDSIGDLLRVGKNRFWDRGIKHYWKNFKWSSDSVRNGRLRADHLLRKVMNGEKLDPTEITDINLIIGTADTKVKDQRGAGAFAHQDVRSAFEGNPDLQQAMRRRFKDAGYTAISNAEETKEKAASEERRKRRENLNTTQRRIKRAYMISKLKNDTAKLDLEKEMMDNEKQFGSDVLGQFKTMFSTLSADIRQSDKNLTNYRTQIDFANKQLLAAKQNGDKAEIAKAQKILNSWEAKEKAEDKHRKDLSRYNGNLIQLMNDTVTGRGRDRDRASMIGIRRLERGNGQPTDTSNIKGTGKKRQNKNKKTKK